MNLMNKKRSFSCGFYNKFLASTNQKTINSYLNSLSLQFHQLVAMLSISNTNSNEDENTKLNNSFEHKVNSSILCSQVQKRFQTYSNFEKVLII